MKTEELIQRLGDSSEPVRRLAKPWSRTVLWLLLALPYVALIVVLMTPRTDLGTKFFEWHFAIEQIASLVTCITAAATAFASTVPGFDRKYLAIPASPLAVWLISVCQGCLQAWMHFGTEGLALKPDWLCLAGIVLVGAIPAITMAVMLRRGAPLPPRLTAALGALAAAAIGSFGLRLFHFHNSNAGIMILVWQMGSVIFFSALASWMGSYLLNWRSLIRKQAAI
jgi:hypothetical protein